MERAGDDEALADLAALTGTRPTLAAKARDDQGAACELAQLVLGQWTATMPTALREAA
ncbi:hypothetical protein [Kitasatospora sp. NPDC059673]|uniref:hypothetical protein n=1 Tax=Kitasatospora sp. NPDC059673 TaxID=3346901 RepID=UPI0036CE950E